jgi:hypothetical protein
MKRNKFSRTLGILALLFIGVFYLNCGGTAFFKVNPGNENHFDGGTTAGNPKFTFQVAGFTENMQIEMCVDRMRFDTGHTPPTTTVPVLSSYTWLSTGGAFPAASNLDGQTYGKIELMLQDQCGTGYALRVTNPQGTFTVPSGVMAFRGSVDTSGPGGTVIFSLNQLGGELVRATSNQDLANALTVEGNF